MCLPNLRRSRFRPDEIVTGLQRALGAAGVGQGRTTTSISLAIPPLFHGGLVDTEPRGDGYLGCMGSHRLDLDVDPCTPPEPGRELAGGLVVRLRLRTRRDSIVSDIRQARFKRHFDRSLTLYIIASSPGFAQS